MKNLKELIKDQINFMIKSQEVKQLKLDNQNLSFRQIYHFLIIINHLMIVLINLT